MIYFSLCLELENNRCNIFNLFIILFIKQIIFENIFL